MQYWLFESSFEEKEFHPITHDEVTYRAWGCVTCVQWPIDRDDGQVVGVIYRTPSGELQRRWKQLKEIRLEEVDEKQWKGIYDLILWDDSDPKSEALPSLADDGSRVLH